MVAAACRAARSLNQPTSMSRRRRPTTVRIAPVSLIAVGPVIWHQPMEGTRQGHHAKVEHSVEDFDDQSADHLQRRYTGRSNDAPNNTSRHERAMGLPRFDGQG